MHWSLLFAVALLAACEPGSADVPGDKDGASTPPDASVTVPPTDEPTVPGVGTVTDVQWRLHDQIGSLVYVTWEQDAAATGHVEYRFDDEWLTSPETELAAGTQEALLLGIPYETDVDIRVVTDFGDGPLTSDEMAATTGPLPGGLPMPVLVESDPTLWEPTGKYLLGSVNSDGGGWSSGEYWMWILDRQGRVVWAMPAVDDHFTIYMTVSKDGDILWDVSTFWSDFDQGAGSRIHRMKIDGVISETYEVPGMHHAFIEMPDGSLLWGSANWDSERLMRLNLDGTTDVVWDCVPFYASLGLSDWCHTNSIWLNEPENTVLMSFPTDDTFVLELDLDDGEVMYWWGHIPQSWPFDPPQSAFQYQHGVTYTDTGTLLVSSQVSGSSIEGVVREYEVDHGAEVLREVWSFGQGEGIEAQYAGEAHRLPNGNTLHNFGTTPRVREITPDKDVVWDVAFSGYKLIGRTVFLEDLYVLAP